MVGSRIKKTVFYIGAAIVVVFILIIAFISPLTKYFLEKYDEKYLGRRVTVDWAYVNPFTGYVYLNNTHIYEANSDTVFFASKGISANISLSQFFSNTYEISELTFDQPYFVIIQDSSKKVNFYDIIQRFSPKDKSRNKDPLKLKLLNVTINNGAVVYRDLAIPINYPVKKVNIKSPGFQWESDTIAARFSFVAGIGKGDVSGSIKINIANLDYQMATVFNKYDLKLIEQYLKDLMNYGVFSASLDADLYATGNFKKAEDVEAKGFLAINNFRFGKNHHDEYASFKKFAIKIRELNPKNRIYAIDSIILDKPFLKYERYDELDNVETIFGKKGTKALSVKESKKFNLIFELGDYILKISNNFPKSDYKVNHLGINDGNLLFNDFHLAEKFSAGIRPLYIVGNSINKNNDRVNLTLKSGLNPYGNISIHFSVNPKDSLDFNLNYHLQKIPATLFNPYLLNYTSFSLNQGKIEITGDWHVRNGIIKSSNHLLIIDPKVAKRIRKHEFKWIPIPLIMAIARERANVIDYNIPITGNLKNPKIHYRDVITDALSNVFIKPLTIPYIVKVKHTEKTIEKALYLKWQLEQSTIYQSQEKFIRKVADFLKENSQSTISIYPLTYEEKEKEHILFYEAKKKYFLNLNGKKAQNYTTKDSLYVAKMSIRDPTFFNHITRYCNDSLLFTIQAKCERYIGEQLVKRRFTELIRNRESTFLEAFKENGTAGRVKIHANESSIPYNGFSFFKIIYDGVMPEALLTAYHDLDQLNDKKPRKKYSKVRQKIKQMFRKK